MMEDDLFMAQMMFGDDVIQLDDKTLKYISKNIEIVFVYDESGKFTFMSSKVLQQSIISQLEKQQTLSDFLVSLTNLTEIVPTVDPLDQEDYKFAVYDSHCHYINKYFVSEEQYNQAYDRFLKKNGLGFTIIGASLADSREALDFAVSHANIYSTVGLHPFAVVEQATTQNLDQRLKEIEEFLKANRQYIKSKIVAIGETGVSSSDVAELKLQVRSLKAHFELALKYDLPVIIHAHKKQHLQIVIDELNEHSTKYSKLRGILHGFSSDIKQLEMQCLDNFMISCNGFIFSQSSNFRKAVNRISVNRLLVETDSPIVKIPGNELAGPADVGHIVKRLADVMESDFESLRDICNENFRRIYQV